MAKGGSLPDGIRSRGHSDIGKLFENDADGNHVACLGSIGINYEKRTFYLRPTSNDVSKKVSANDMMYFIAHDRIEWGDPGNRDKVVHYIMQMNSVQEVAETRQQAVSAATDALAEIDVDLANKKRYSGAVARSRAIMGASALAIAGAAAAVMVRKPAEAVGGIAGSIEGEGFDLGVSSDNLAHATQVSVMGDLNEIYGITFDSKTFEVSMSGGALGRVDELVSVNPYVSSIPSHMRPLYYRKDAFHQTRVIVDHAMNGQYGVYMDNPVGFINGKLGYRLMLVGGKGMNSIVIREPVDPGDIGADQAAQQLYKEREALRKGRSSDSSEDEDEEDRSSEASLMKASWLGIDKADIDSSRIALSYWYPAEGNDENRSGIVARKIALIDVSTLVDGSATDPASVPASQLDYLDTADYKDPAISCSPSSNSTHWWIAYTRDGEFRLRKWEKNIDLVERGDLTDWSCYDVTGSDSGVTDYQLMGDMLFFVQDNTLRCEDLSGLSLSYGEDGAKMVARLAPVDICPRTDIRSNDDSDMIAVGNAEGIRPTPAPRYEAVRVSTSSGSDYGIIYISNRTGELVFANVGTILSTQGRSGAKSLEESRQDRAAAEEEERKRLEEQAAEQERLRLEAEEQERKRLEEQAAAEERARQEEQARRAAEEEAARQAEEERIRLEEEERIRREEEARIAQEQGGQPAPEAPAPDAVAFAGRPPAMVPVADEQVLQDIADEAEALEASPSKPSASAETSETSRFLTVLRTPAEGSTIVCFTANGSQVIWIEEDMSGERTMRISPIYYRGAGD